MGSLNRNTPDVTIVGAGPAGTLLAYELAKNGIDVLLLEKEELPRYKVCAGGVNVRAARLLPFEIEPVVENTIYGMKLSYELGSKCVRKYDEPLTYMVMRDKFDSFLVEKARAVGARVLDKQKVHKVITNGLQAVVHTQDKSFASRILVGADGANSIVSKELALMRKRELDIGIECEVYVDDVCLSEWGDFIALDYGELKGGYAWVFPKQDHLSIGAGCALSAAPKLRSYIQRFLQSQDLGNYRIASYKGHLLPLRNPGMPITKDQVLLLGDAAGLVDAFTGDGIYYAIWSAQVAASVIKKCLDEGTTNVGEYGRLVDVSIMPELLSARALVKIKSLAPGFLFKQLRDSERVWRAFCRILRGEKTYVSVKGELGPFQFLFDLLSR